jgi:hypothetical protein
VHRDGKLNGSEACAGVSANPRTRIDYELTDLVGDLLKVIDT